MMLALCLGTMGLPHVLVRYYTNPDGVAARRTTVTVVALLGVFYLVPPVYAVLGRVHLPSLPSGVRSDTIVLQLPERVVSGVWAGTCSRRCWRAAPSRRCCRRRPDWRCR